MKKLLLVLTFFAGSLTTARSQDKLCKDIIRTIDNGSVIYTAPTPGTLLNNVMHFSLFKTINAGGSHIYLDLAYILYNPDEKSTEASVKFDDGTVLTFPNVVYTLIEQPADKYKVTTWLYKTLIEINADDLQKLKTKKVNRYTVAGRTGATPPLCNFKDRIMAYANFMDTATASPDEIDPAKLFARKFDDMKSITTYSTPSNNHIQVFKTIDASGMQTWIMFYAHKDIADDKPQTVYVKFDDGKVLNFPSASSNCIREGRGQYLYTCGLNLSADNIQSFKDKKIVKFQIADTDVLVDNTLGVSVNSWVNNLDKLK